MALDTDKLRSHLKDSGLFSDAEIEAEVLSAQKDAKAEERKSILNTQKVEAPAVAESSPAIAAASPTAAAKAPSILSVPTAPAGTSPADIASGAVSPTGMGLTPEQRVGNVGVNVAKAGGNAIQDTLDYAHNAIANNPELTGALAAIPVAYGANKLGLFDNLASKMSASAAPTQPQPFVGGSGPRVTPPAPVVTPATSPIQNWDIHSDPSFGNFLGDVTAPAAVEAPTANTKLQELQARLAAGTGEMVGPPAPVGPPKPIAPTPPAAPAASIAPSVAPEAAPAKTPWAPPTAEVINKPSMFPSGSTLTPSAAVSPEGAPVNPVEPSAEEAAAAKAAEEKKAKMPLFSDADKKAFTSEQRSVLQHMQYGQTPEEAKNLLRHFENTLPEDVKLSYGTYPEDVYNEAGKKIKTAGTSKGGFPEPKQNLLDFWNEALGTNHTLNEKGNFDYKPTPEDVTKAHSYWSEKMANATTPAAKSIAEKGYASLGALAKLAGISLGALGAMHAYKTGKETGDWSDLGLLGGSLLAGASAPAQIAYQGLTYSKPLGETQEQLKQLGKQLEYAGKVGYGRGLVNPSNAIPPPRHTMTNR